MGKKMGGKRSRKNSTCACFAAMEQYRRNFSPLNLINSAFAQRFESRVVTFNRLIRLSRPTLIELSHYSGYGSCRWLTFLQKIF